MGPSGNIYTHNGQSIRSVYLIVRNFTACVNTIENFIGIGSSWKITANQSPFTSNTAP